MMKKLNVAIIGQGRSGKDIHGLYYRGEKNVYYNVAYVVDRDEYRRGVAEAIYPRCVALSDYRELFDKSDIDLVVNASYSEDHYPITEDLLSHGFIEAFSADVAEKDAFELAKVVVRESGVWSDIFRDKQKLLQPYMMDTHARVRPSRTTGNPSAI